jgi:phosphoribosyl-ATP pyrophosphohydrolase
MAELKGFVNGFLVTFVEREGRMGGVDLDRVAEVVAGSDKVRVTVAGGVTTAQEIAAIDRLGADAQVGMALYTGHLDLAEAITSPLRSDRPDRLWPTVVVDQCGLALGLAWSNPESVREAIRTRQGVYHSRSRGLWVKGMASGNTQELLQIDLDCDRDTLRFTVDQQGSGFCHRGTRTCWGDDGGISSLFRRLETRRDAAPEGSYTRRLLGDPQLLAAKLTEEAAELAMASREEVIAEAADLIYFVLVAMVRAGVKLRDVEAELNRRSFRLSRRPGNAKTSVEGNQ